MTYQTLYRKYRSSSLDELVGQTHIIKTLTNAIQYDRLSHGYIFSGPRGTGKTSTARILAKMVNKTTDDVQECPLCQKISEGSCVDVIEIDAASHTGVDHMRQLTEQVQFLPVEAKVKVFIIDEVHMLSSGAFNALLKTLEEPPSNILFILATTELHKIPATIQSRAQTLHFRLLEEAQIRDHIRYVCDNESFTIDDQALTKLVQVSNGGMRDAMSLLDQLMSMTDNQTISLANMTHLLGSLDHDALGLFLNQCFLYEPAAYQTLKGHLDRGVDVFQLYDDIIFFLHDALLVKEQHSFSVSNQQVSDWLQWFCDQLVVLKDMPSPVISAQVALYLKITSGQDIGGQPDSAIKDQSGSRQTNSKQPSQNIQMSTSNVSADVLANASTSHQPSQPIRHDQDEKTHALRSDDLPLSSTQHQTDDALNSVSDPSNVDSRLREESQHPDEISEDPKRLTSIPVNEVGARVLADVAEEFQVLKPVLKGARLIEHGQSLCLVLEETYRFFEKKLAEDKFKSRFLSLYQDATNGLLSDWVVTSDVNVIYNRVKTDDSGEAMNAVVQSKTINQIVEMFEGEVIK